MLLLDDPSQRTSLWTLRYVVLLWLSLICMIPFDFAQFDDPGSPGKTASAIESLARRFLGQSGLEREGAAMLLSRFYMRYDVACFCSMHSFDFRRKDTRSSFYSFVDWARSSLLGPIDLFLVSSEWMQKPCQHFNFLHSPLACFGFFVKSSNLGLLIKYRPMPCRSSASQR
jgi:hypothetical protein